MPQMSAPPRESSSFLNAPLKEWSSTSVLVLTGFGTFFFFLLSVMLVSRGVHAFYERFGTYSPAYDVHLAHFATLSVIPFLFNMPFAAYFGIVFARGLGRGVSQSLPSGIRRAKRSVLNWGLLGLAAWFALFNFPTLAASVDSFLHPSFLYTKVPLIITWPPLSMPFEIRVEFALFCAMGNLGIFAGFSSGVLLSELRRLRALARL